MDKVRLKNLVHKYIYTYVYYMDTNTDHFTLLMLRQFLYTPVIRNVKKMPCRIYLVVQKRELYVEHVPVGRTKKC